MATKQQSPTDNEPLDIPPNVRKAMDAELDDYERALAASIDIHLRKLGDIPDMPLTPDQIDLLSQLMSGTRVSDAKLDPIFDAYPMEKDAVGYFVSPSSNFVNLAYGDKIQDDALLILTQSMNTARTALADNGGAIGQINIPKGAAAINTLNIEGLQSEDQEIIVKGGSTYRFVGQEGELFVFDLVASS